MKKLYTLLLICCLSVVGAYSQAPKRELLATWLATVWQLDWPYSKISSTGNTALINAQKNQMIGILDNLASININAIFFQVRSRCDAMYKSSYEPWSSDLVTTRGMDPGYDPLEFVVEEAHKRGIEVHAWMNPYRFSTASTYWDGQAGDYRATNPDWIMTYPVSGTTYYSIMNPGLPEVRQRITDIVEEVVTNYDVDGVIFDDYFYSYSGTPADLDIVAQNLYRPTGMTLSDWRRNNINQLVSKVYHMIQDTKPYVRFGISPFGIWTTNASVAQQEGIILPTGITGANTYESIYCDPVAWLKEGTVDYISPQLYWPTYQTAQSYDVLCPWWSDLAFRFKKHFYSSHSISAIEDSNYTMSAPLNQVIDINGEDVDMGTMSSMERSIYGQQEKMDAPQTRFGPEEIGLQINRNRVSSRDGAPGSVFYSTKYIYNVKGVMPYLKQYWFGEKALIPAIDWKIVSDEITPVTAIQLEGQKLTWNSSNENVRFSIYAIPNSLLATDNIYNVSTYLQGISYTKEFTINTSIDLANTTLAVAILDRYGNEYTPTVMAGDLGACDPVTLVSPVNGETMLGTFAFRWNIANVDWYTVEIAEDAQFSKIHSRKVCTTNELYTDNIADLEIDKTYYWRVLSHKAGYSNGISESRNFILDEFSVNTPINGMIDSELTPQVSWRKIGDDQTTYQVLISSVYNFADLFMIYSQEVKGATEITIPSGLLMPMTTYYVKVKTIIDGKNVETAVNAFTTKMVYPEIPTIISPLHESNVAENTILVKWADNIYATGFQVHLSKDESFPIRNLTSKSTGAFKYEVDFGDLTPDTYYTRVRANHSEGQTEWSPVVKFQYYGATAIQDYNADEAITLIKDGNSHLLRIDSNQSNQPTTIQLFDITGKLVRSYEPVQPIGDVVDIPLQMGVLSKGIYLVKVVFNGQIKVFKLIN